ncbi:MAG TPA: hypothetical protein VII92_00385 [Anaerolineae bacterium]
MKKTSPSKPRPTVKEMRAEYQFDYDKARPNRFAGKADEAPLVVVLDPDVAEVFTNSESVNTALRALITAIPRTAKRKTVRKGSTS